MLILLGIVQCSIPPDNVICCITLRGGDTSQGERIKSGRLILVVRLRRRTFQCMECVERRYKDNKNEWLKKQLLRKPERIGVRLHDVGQAFGVAAAHAAGNRDLMAFAGFQHKPISCLAPFGSHGEFAEFVGF